MSFNSSTSNDVTHTGLGGARKRRMKGNKGFLIVHTKKLKALGETDMISHVVKLNDSWHKPGNPHRPTKSRKVPEKLKTLVHERDHIRHPKKHEHTVQKDTNRIVKRMPKKQKQKLYKKKYL